MLSWSTSHLFTSLVFNNTTNNTTPTMSTWEVRFSNSRKLPYFYNSATNESTWEPPSGLTEDQVRALPGSQHLSGGGSGGGRPDGQVRASHILAKHSGSRRPSSWKDVS